MEGLHEGRAIMDKDKRRKNYQRLRDAGFSARDATLLKNRASYKIDYLVTSMNNFTRWKEKTIQRTKGKGKMK